MRRGCLFFALMVSVLLAQFSPGDLSRYHAQFEGRTNCTQCHILGERELSDGCLECHTPLHERIQAGRGYHADKPDKCGRCHSDHNGRKFELVYWPGDMEDFDHAETGYTLSGKHADLPCAQCHTRSLITGEAIRQWAEAWNGFDVLDRTFLGLEQACLSCHTDIHNDEVADDCEQCHNTVDWQKASTTFDHDRARFLITGAHKQVDCEKCHPQRNTPTTAVWQLTGMAFDRCGRCHEDVHRGSYGSNCEACHSTSYWKRDLKPFDHARTDYPLLGRHSGLNCSQCHTPELSGRLPEFDNCQRCHADTHDGQFTNREGPLDCAACHSVYGFLPARYSLVSHQDTRFPLTGSHLAVPCLLCHPRSDEADPASTRLFHLQDQRCQACHIDIHRGQLESRYANDCTACHNTVAFTRVSFDHDQTAFPLDGRHKTVACDKCHGIEQDQDGLFHRYVPIPHTCQDCHTLTGEIR